MKKNTFFGFSLLFLILMPTMVFAEGSVIPDFFGDAIENIAVMIGEIWMQRALLFLAIFSIMYGLLYGVDPLKLKKEKNSINVTLALAIGLISVAGLNAKTIELIFGLFQGLFVSILVLGPLIAGLVLAYKNENDNHMIHLLRAFIYGLLMVVLNSGVIPFPQGFIVQNGFSWADLKSLFNFFFFIMFIVEFFRMFKLIGAGRTSPVVNKYASDVADSAKGMKNIWDRFGKSPEEKKLEKEEKALTKYGNAIETLKSSIADGIKGLMQIHETIDKFLGGKHAPDLIKGHGGELSKITGVLEEKKEKVKAEFEDIKKNMDGKRKELEALKKQAENFIDKLKSSLSPAARATFKNNVQTPIETALKKLDDLNKVYTAFDEHYNKIDSDFKSYDTKYDKFKDHLSTLINGTSDTVSPTDLINVRADLEAATKLLQDISVNWATIKEKYTSVSNTEKSTVESVHSAINTGNTKLRMTVVFKGIIDSIPETTIAGIGPTSGPNVSSTRKANTLRKKYEVFSRKTYADNREFFKEITGADLSSTNSDNVVTTSEVTNLKDILKNKFKNARLEDKLKLLDAFSS
ncbi:hypothetical protein K9L97_06065 [Candidatus Woesearchaeota archaeon]|nr:hypothetical protein [Candidatus Woesearchaeota archaeon]